MNRMRTRFGMAGRRHHCEDLLKVPLSALHGQAQWKRVWKLRVVVILRLHGPDREECGGSSREEGKWKLQWNLPV
ncbi:uncharacterized protein MONOS_17749 [Monocercomonoides exilis]|uniref:uncharacterized protein n=1 Tax=Monocercomonoides exilis TaxID=2049356 RepID=UPI0035596D2E|nr:hypothetical protein MONOS_17749 [Monocercomonoides exilis]